MVVNYKLFNYLEFTYIFSFRRQLGWSSTGQEGMQPTDISQFVDIAKA